MQSKRTALPRQCPLPILFNDLAGKADEADVGDDGEDGQVRGDHFEDFDHGLLQVRGLGYTPIWHSGR